MPQGKRGSEIDQLAVEYSNQVLDQEADRQGVPRDFARRIAGIESSDRADVITGGRRSSAGAIGKMQLMPGTAKDLGVDPYNIDQNIAGGVKYLGQQLKSFGGDQRLAAAAYNAGPGNVRKYKGVPPFAETQKYAANFGGGTESEIDKLAREFNGQQSSPLTPAKPLGKPTQPLKKPDTTSPFSFARPTGFAAAERAVSDLEVSPEVQAQANKQNQAYNAYSQKSLGGRLAEDATLAAARAGEWAQQTGQRTIGTVLGLAKGATNPQLGFAPIDIRSQAGKAAQEATGQRLAEREAAAPDPSSKIRRGLIQGALQAPVYAAAAEAGGLPALAALNVAQEDFKDPLRSGARAIANTVVPLAGGKLGQMAVSPLAKGLAPAANAATRYAGEAVGGAATNVAQAAAEQRIFDGKVDPRELVSQAVIGGVLSPAMARGGVRRQVAADQAQMTPAPVEVAPAAPSFERPRPLNRAIAPEQTAPLSPVLPSPRPKRRPAILPERTAPLTEPLVPNAPETTRMPAPIGAETTRSPEPVTAPETTRVTSPEEATPTAETPQQKRNRLISANKQRADAKRAEYDEAFASGDYGRAERSLIEQQQLLKDVNSILGRKQDTPGDSAFRARLKADISEIGNRIGNVRKQRRASAAESNKPTKEISTPLGENAPETTRVPSEPIQDTTLMPRAQDAPATTRVTGEQDLPTRDLAGDELLAPTERELAGPGSRELRQTTEIQPEQEFRSKTEPASTESAKIGIPESQLTDSKQVPLVDDLRKAGPRIADRARVLRGGGETQPVGARGTENLRPPTRVPEANTNNIKALEARYENATRTINERPDSVSQDLRDYRRELGAAIGEYRRANQSADSRALRNLPRPTPEQLVKQGERDAQAARDARDYFRNAKPPETGALPAEASPRPQGAALDTTQPERLPSGRLGIENEISQAERDAINRRVSKMNPEQLDAALRDAEAARNEDIAKPQMGGMTRRLAGAYREALNDRRKQLVKEKALPAKAPLSADESIGLKWSRDEEFGAEARAFKEEFGRWPEDLSELQTGEPRQSAAPKESSPTIQHERFGEVKVIEKAPSGKLLVEDKDGNSHTIKNPRTAGGNRTASFTRKPLTEELAIPVADQMAKLSESAVGKSEPLKAAPDRLANLDAPIKQEWLIKGNAPPELFGAQTLQELFKLPGGRQWWEENGRKFESGMELKPRQSTAELKPSETIEGIDPVNDPQGWRDFLKSIRDKKSEPRSKTVTRYGQEEGAALTDITKQWDQVRENISTLEVRLRKAKKGKREEIQTKLSELRGKDAELEAQYKSAQGKLSETERKEDVSLPGKNIFSARFTPGSKGRQGNLYLSKDLFEQATGSKAEGVSVDLRKVRNFLQTDAKSLPDTERAMIQSALREATSLGSKRISAARLPEGDGGSLQYTKKISRHESIHSAQPIENRHPKTFNQLVSDYGSQKSDVNDKIIASLKKSGSYRDMAPGRLLITEGPAFIGSGDAKGLGLTEAEGEAFYKDYIDRVYQTGGFEPLMDLALQSRPTPKYAKMMGEVLSWAAENEKAKNFPTTKPAIVAKAEARLKEIAAGRRAGSGAQALLDQAIVTGYKVYKAGMDFVQWSQAAVKDAGDAIRPQLRKAWEALQADRQGAFDEAREGQNERIAELGERQSAKGVRVLELNNQRKQIENARGILREEARANQAAGRPIPEGLRKSFQEKTAELQRLRKDEARNISLRDQAASEAEGLRAGQLDAAKAAKGGRADELTRKREDLETERKVILADQSAMEKAGEQVPAAVKKRLASLDREIKQARKGELKNRVLSGLKEFYTDEGGSALAGFNPTKQKTPQAPAKPSASPAPSLPAGLARQRAIAQANKAAAPQAKPAARPAQPPAAPKAPAQRAPQTAQEYFDEQLQKSPFNAPGQRVKDLANEEARSALKKAADRVARGKMEKKQEQSVISAAEDLMMAGRLGDQAKIKQGREDLLRAMRNTDQQSAIGKAARAVGRAPLSALRAAQSTVYGGDISFPLRQAAPMTLNPFNALRTYKAVKAAYNAFGREEAGNRSVLPGSKGAEEVRKQLESHPRYDLANKAGVELSVAGSQEEVYRDAGWSEKVLGLKTWMKRTQAANETFLDMMRLEVFDKYAKAIEKNKKLSPKQQELAMKSAADVINTMSGRTDLGEGKVKQFADFTNGIFAAPRLMVSRAKLLNPAAIPNEWRKNPDVAKQMLKDTVGVVGPTIAVLTMTAAAGAKVGWNPEDEDFGKVVVNSTAIDFMPGGVTPIAKLAYAWGKVADAVKTEALDPSEENKKARQREQRNAIFRTGRFTRSKLGPATSYVADLLYFGEDFEKNKMNLRSTINPMDPNFAPYRLAAPLGVTGAVKDAKEEGSSAGKVALTSALEFFGASAYNKKARGERLDRESKFIQESEGQGLNFRNWEKKPGEPENLFKARSEKSNAWMTQYGDRLVDSSEYKNAPKEQKERMLRSLKTRIATQSNQKSPTTSNFAPAAILRSVRQGERRERRNRGRLIFAGEEE